MNDLEQYVEVLMGITDPPYDHSFYRNSRGVQGYKATYRVGTDWYWYSVNRTNREVTPYEVAMAVKEGRAKRMTIVKLSGLEATIEHERQWFMINRGSV